MALPALVFEAEGAEHGVWLNHLSHVDEQFTLVAAEQSLTEPPSKIAVHVLSSPDGESWQDQVIGGAGDDLLVTPLTGGTRCMEPWQGSLVALGEDWGLDQRPRLFITAASVETWSTIEGLAPGNATACASDGSAVYFLGRSLDPEPILFRSTDLPTLEPITLPSAVGPLSDLAM